MINKCFYQVKEFHDSFDMPIGTTNISSNPEYLTKEDANRIQLRHNLIAEEYKEVMEAQTPEEIMKESCDLIYVILGMFVEFGWDFEEAFSRVHESNMSKLGEDGKPIYREDGKVLKGPNYKLADLSDII